MRIITRDGYDWTDRFAPVAVETQQLGHETMILDGEAVVLDDKGRSDFGMLQRALSKKPSLHDPREILFFAFDLLYLDGRELRRLPLSERRLLLESIVVAGRAGVIRLSEEVEADGEEFSGSPASTAWRGFWPSAVTSPITPAGAPIGRRSNAFAATAS